MNHATDFQRMPNPPSSGAAPRLLSIPDLWERARVLFARLIERGRAPRLGREQRREILDWLHPVEGLVRTVLVAKAITWLMMTPQGRALMRPAPKASATLRCQPPGATCIARSARAAAAARARSFRLLSSRPFASLSPAGAGDHTTETRTGIAPGSGADANARQVARAIAIARRIEVLSRAIEKPAPLIHRLARTIAAFPGIVLGYVLPDARELDRWRHGYPEFIDARMHFRRARASLAPPDPG